MPIQGLLGLLQRPHDVYRKPESEALPISALQALDEISYFPRQRSFGADRQVYRI
jgi:hypothetical protein